MRAVRHIIRNVCEHRSIRITLQKNPPLWGDSPHKRRFAVSAGLYAWKLGRLEVIWESKKSFFVMSGHYRQMSRYNNPSSFSAILADNICERETTGIIENKTFIAR